MMPGQLGGDLARELTAPPPGAAGAVHVCAPAIRAAAVEPDRVRRSPAGKPFGQHELGVAVRSGPGCRARERARRRRRDANRGSTQGRRALIVDDDPDVAETMGDALEQAGLPATIAHTGAEAIRIAGDVRPVLVFCDVTLGKGTVRLRRRARPARRSAAARHDADRGDRASGRSVRRRRDRRRLRPRADQADRSRPPGGAGPAPRLRPREPVNQGKRCPGATQRGALFVGRTGAAHARASRRMN